LKRLYLAGPVSGQLQKAKLVFQHAEGALVAAGYEVINPITSANNPAAEAEEAHYGKAAAGRPQWQRVMVRCLRDMLTCDGVMLLYGWEHSEGAMFEKLVAERCGLWIGYFEKWQSEAAS